MGKPRYLAAKLAALIITLASSTSAQSPSNDTLRIATPPSLGSSASEIAREEQASCDSGQAKACNRLGLQYEHGDGVPRDYARAASLYSRACDAGVAGACNNLGTLMLLGNGVPSDPQRASDLFKRACKAGSEAACNNWAQTLDSKSQADLAEAAITLEDLCSRGHRAACNNFGTMVMRGEGVKRDPARAVVIFDNACTAGSVGACNNLGVMLGTGSGVPMDRDRAIAAFRRALKLRPGDPKVIENLRRLGVEP